MGFARRLHRESEDWVAEGLLSPKAREALLERYPITPAGSWAASILAGLAAVFMAAGVISLVAYNWEVLPKEVRLVLAILPLLLSHAALLWWYLGARRKKRAVFREVVVIVNGFALLLAVGLLSQIYHIQGSAFWFLVLCMALYAPVILFTRSLAGGILYTFVLGISFFFGAWDEAWAPLAFTLFGLVPVLSWLKDRKDESASQSIWWIGVCGASVGLLILGGASLKGGLWLVNLGLIGSLLGLIGMYETKAGKALLIPSAVIAIISFAIIGFQATWQWLLPSSGQELADMVAGLNPVWLWWLGIAMGISVTGAVLSAVVAKRWSPLLVTGPAMGLFWFVPQFVQAQDQALWICLASNLLVLIQGTIWVMDKEKLPSRVIGGSLLILGVVNQRFFDGDFSLIIKGVIFVGSGGLLWLLYRVRYGSSTRKWS